MKRTGPSWEFRDVRIDRAASHEETRAFLTASAETGNWELAQTRIYRDGRRHYRLRRRVYRVQRST